MTPALPDPQRSAPAPLAPAPEPADLAALIESGAVLEDPEPDDLDEPTPIEAAPSRRARPVLDYALEAVAAGLAVLPPRQDGTKAPDVPRWREYQSRRPTEDEVLAWYARPRTGLGVLTGQVSGGLEMLELEGRAVAEGLDAEFRRLAAAAGLGAVLDRIMAGYAEATPRGGYHLLFRVPTPRPSTKLAARPATATELAASPGERAKVLIETRGEGGYVVVAPSHGRVHPEGGAWRLLAGGFATLATITDAERDALFAVARALDAMPVEVRPAPAAGAGDRPGDRYNAAPDVQERTVALLERHGWTRVYERGGVAYLRRPGKPPPGVSASVGFIAPGVVRVFTTADADLPEGAHDPFGVYARLEHGGDFALAARSLEPKIEIDGTRSGAPDGTAETDPPAWRTLLDIPDTPPGELLFGMLEPDGSTLAYAAPGVGKGTTGAWLVVEALAAGMTPVIFDAERRPREWARRVAGLGGDRSRVVYLDPGDLGPTLAGRPFWDQAEAVGRIVRAAGGDLFFLDSLLPAAGVGEDRLRSDAQAPFLFVAALDAIGASARLAFGHPPKGQPEGEPFGSMAWLAAFRLTWLGTTAEGDGHRIRWRPRKRNERGHVPGVLLTVAYGDDGRPCAVERADDEETTRDALLAALVHGPRRVPELAEQILDEMDAPAPGELERVRERVGRMLRRMAREGWVERVGPAGGRNVAWQLRVRDGQV